MIEIQLTCKIVMSVCLILLIDILIDKLISRRIMEDYELIIKGTTALIEFIIAVLIMSS